MGFPSTRAVQSGYHRSESRSNAGTRPELRGETVCEMLEEMLAMEKAAVAFYDLLAERTPVPAVRDVFRALADAERGHGARLADRIREVCGDAADA